MFTYHPKFTLEIGYCPEIIHIIWICLLYWLQCWLIFSNTPLSIYMNDTNDTISDQRRAHAYLSRTIYDINVLGILRLYRNNSVPYMFEADYKIHIHMTQQSVLTWGLDICVTFAGTWHLTKKLYRITWPIIGDGLIGATCHSGDHWDGSLL